MKKLFLTIAVVFLSAASISAQKDKSGIEYQNLRGSFVTNSFGDNWFISIGAGIDGWVRPKKGVDTSRGLNKVGPTFDLSVGKMLHPVYGVRIQGTYGTIKDYTGFAGKYAGADSGKPEGYDLKFDYWSLGGDFMFHFSNAVSGYKEARFYNAIIFVGAAYTRSNGKNVNGVKSHVREFAGKFGLLNTFRLASGLDLNLELKALVVSQQFSGNGRGAGLIPAATLGFTYKFKDRRFYTVNTAIDNAVTDATRSSSARIRDLERELASAEALAKQSKSEADAAREAARRAEAEAARRGQNQGKNLNDFDKVPVAFFERGKSDIQSADMSIPYVAEIIKANPGKTYTVVGLADKETGTHEGNMALSRQRAETIKNALVNAGVPSSQLKIEALGDTVNPYDGDMNRVVIIELK